LWLLSQLLLLLLLLLLSLKFVGVFSCCFVRCLWRIGVTIAVAAGEVGMEYGCA
jgi:hypothetical protein